MNADSPISGDAVLLNAPTHSMETTITPATVGKLVGMTELKPGYTVRVHELIKDVNGKGEERERIQIFEGLVLSVRGVGRSQTFTVYKKSEGWGVEKIYPLQAPVVSKVEFVRASEVRRAKLHYVANPKKPFGRQMKEKKVAKKTV